MTYQEARAQAQEKANASGCDFGVEKNAFGFSCFSLPRQEHRTGHELRCEVVSCMDLSKVQSGHGGEGDFCGWHGCTCSKRHH